MKKFRVTLSDGEVLTFSGLRLVRDGMGVHIYAEDDHLVAGFTLSEVRSCFEIPPPE